MQITAGEQVYLRTWQISERESTAWPRASFRDTGKVF